ncbi:MAG: glycosyltransferase family 4 protein [Balneolaceae bacterium]
MKILYFHQHFSTPEGSTGTRSYEMARKLLERGHRVTMVCGSYQLASSGLKNSTQDGIKRGEVDGIDVIEFQLPYSNNDSFLKRTSTFLKYSLKSSRLPFSESYDLLFATSTPLTAGIPGIIMKRFRAKKFVFEVRDLWPELPREMGVITNPFVLKGMEMLEWASYKSADGCIALSPGIKKGIERRAKNKRVEMIPNGCDLDLFKPSSEKRVQIPGVETGDFVALFTGAHGIANGLDAAVDAAAELRKRGENSVKLVFIGDGREKPRLREKAGEFKLKNCIFLDPVPKTDLPQFLHRADTGLMLLQNIPAFYYGTSPNKFFDYISSGLPVLNNYPGWVAELISRNKCGVVVEPGSPEKFADGLITLKNHKNLDQMKKNSRKLAEESFNREKLSAQFADFLESVYRSK